MAQTIPHRAADRIGPLQVSFDTAIERFQEHRAYPYWGDALGVVPGVPHASRTRAG